MVVDKVLETIQRENLIDPGDKVILAVSGGPDSVCLLHVMASLQDKLNFTLYGAHLNHQIRGLEAQKDALYSARLCDELSVPFFVKAADVPLYAKEKKISLEEAARNLRYQMLYQLKDQLQAQKIAVAHNMDDQAETVLMRILRGTGLRGIRGMEYKRQDALIRPLMDVLRWEIEDYCQEKELYPRIDHTNAEAEYTRNKIRLNLIPYIETEFAPNVKQILHRMALSLGEDANYIEGESQRTFSSYCSLMDASTVRLDIEDAQALPKAILKRVVLLAIQNVLGSGKDMETVHLEDVMDLIFRGKKEGRLNLPHRLLVIRSHNSLYFTTKEIENSPVEYCYPLPFNGTAQIKELGIQVECKVMHKDRCKVLPTGQFVKAFDLEKVKGGLQVRSRRLGDKIRPMGLGGTKKVKDIFIDMKLDANAKSRIPIICDDEAILWVGGCKISEDYKISEKTQDVVRITIREFEEEKEGRPSK